MDLRELISENKDLLKKYIMIGAIITFLSFWVFYNIYRVPLSGSIEFSWGVGILSALGFTVVLIAVYHYLKIYMEKKDISLRV